MQTIFEDVEAGNLNYLLIQHVPSIYYSVGKNIFMRYRSLQFILDYWSTWLVTISAIRSSCEQTGSELDPTHIPPYNYFGSQDSTTRVGFHSRSPRHHSILSCTNFLFFVASYDHSPSTLQIEKQVNGHDIAKNTFYVVFERTSQKVVSKSLVLNPLKAFTTSLSAA